MIGGVQDHARLITERGGLPPAVRVVRPGLALPPGTVLVWSDSLRGYVSGHLVCLASLVRVGIGREFQAEPVQGNLF